MNIKVVRSGPVLTICSILVDASQAHAVQQASLLVSTFTETCQLVRLLNLIRVDKVFRD